MKHIAKKSLGQHFLVSQRVLDEIIEAAEITKEDTIFEIGPGTGNLTKKLLLSPAKKIIAVEKENRLYRSFPSVIASEAKQSQKLPNRLKLIHGDALTLIPDLIVEKPFKVVANLPYNIAAPAIISLLSVCPTLPSSMVLMLQKEVAERIICPAGNSNRGLLTVFIELFGRAEIVTRVLKHHFSPPPQVDSAVVKISGIQKLSFPPEAAIRVLKAAFAGKRKKIKNSLFSTFQIPPNEAQKIAKKCGFGLDQRPEELNIDQWRALIENLI